MQGQEGIDVDMQDAQQEPASSQITAQTTSWEGTDSQDTWQSCNTDDLEHTDMH